MHLILPYKTSFKCALIRFSTNMHGRILLGQPESMACLRVACGALSAIRAWAIPRAVIAVPARRSTSTALAMLDRETIQLLVGFFAVVIFGVLLVLIQQ